MPFLTRPSEKYRESYIQALREIQAEGKWLNLNIQQIEKDFGTYVKDVLRREDGTTQDAGLVPETILWLIDGDEYIGRVSIRHELTESLLRSGGHIGYDIRPSKRLQGYGRLILKLALVEARELGLNRVLLTCNPGNTGSKKIIEGNGGVLENEVIFEQDGRERRRLRYWIDIK